MTRAILNIAIEEANVQANVDVATGNADVHVSAVMADDDDDDNSLTLSEKSSALHPWPHLFSTLITLLALSTPPSTSIANLFFLHHPPPLFPSPLLHLLLLLGSPPEIQEFSLS